MAKALPRGIRNNNPLNIRISKANNWQGRVPLARNTDGAFEQFATAVDGIRAAARLLITHYDRGADTLGRLIAIWAPSHENRTETYVAAVAREAGLDPAARLDLHRHAVLRPVLTAMIRVENGQQPYGAAQLDEGLRRAGVVAPPPTVAAASAAAVAQALATGGGLGLAGLTVYAQQAGDAVAVAGTLVAALRAADPLVSAIAVAAGLGMLGWTAWRHWQRRRDGLS